MADGEYISSDPNINADLFQVPTDSIRAKVKLVPILQDLNLIINIQPFNGQLIVSTQPGQIWLVDPDCSTKKLFLDISKKIGPLGLNITGTNDSSNNNLSNNNFSLYDQRGLLGIAFEPCNSSFYIYYSSIARNTNSPPVEMPDPYNPSTLNQEWTDESLYDHLNILEEWNLSGQSVHFVRPLLIIKQPFHNNNGMNNLIWDCERNGLLLTTGDGGYLYDPFNLAQNDDYPHGKVLLINPAKINYNYPIASHDSLGNALLYPNYAIARLSQLERDVLRGITVLVKGIRNNHGIYIKKDLGHFLIYNGQSNQEALYRIIDNLHNLGRMGIVDVLNNRLIRNNIGWAGWNAGQPTTSRSLFSGSTANTIISNYNSPITQTINSTKFSLLKGVRAVNPKLKLISWNKNSISNLTIELNNGDMLRFLSNDNNFYDLNLTDSNFNIIKNLVETSSSIDHYYQIESLDNLYFSSTDNPNMRLTVIVQPVQSVISDLDWVVSQLSSQISINDVIPYLSSDINVITYNDRILVDRINPYLSPNFLMSKITGLTYYNGARGLYRGLIMAEWNKRINSQVTANRGQLTWINPYNPQVNKVIEIVGINSLGGFFTAIGTDLCNNRIFLGTYSSINAGELGKGTLYEIIPL